MLPDTATNPGLQARLDECDLKNKPKGSVPTQRQITGQALQGQAKGKPEGPRPHQKASQRGHAHTKRQAGRGQLPVAMMLYTEAQQVQDHAHGVGAYVRGLGFCLLLLQLLLLLLTAGAQPCPFPLHCSLHEPPILPISLPHSTGKCANTYVSSKLHTLSICMTR